MGDRMIKTNRIIIIFTQDIKAGSMSMEVTVDGKKKALPEALRNWITRSYLEELLHRTRR